MNQLCFRSIMKTALVTFVQVLNHPNFKTRFIKMQDLKADAKYRVSFPDESETDFPPAVLTGTMLSNAGFAPMCDWGGAFRAD